MNKQLLTFLILVVVIVLGYGIARVLAPSNSLGGGFTSFNDYYKSGVTTATTTINTTSTQLVASVTKTATIVNPSTSTITCLTESTIGTTAASSSVAATLGYTVGPQGTAGNLSQMTFGECYPGALNCIPFKGTINCVANTAAAVTLITK